MIKNFAELKNQLEELSSVINSFKSESVQLRIVELIFQIESDEEPNTSSDTQEEKPRRRKRISRNKGANKTDKSEGTPRKKSSGGKKGPAAILAELIGEDFFQSNRTIKAIMDHSSSQKARIFKANELSSPLARFVRDNRLKREKNSDGQYEYYK